MLAFPGEVGLAAASLLTGGTLAVCPGLRIAFSHGGGSLPTLLPRLRHAWRVLPAVREVLGIDPLLAARQMYYDDLVYDADVLHRLIALFGIDQLLAGSDYLFVIMDPDPAVSIATLGLDAVSLAALRGGNARRWLGLSRNKTVKPGFMRELWSD